MKRWLIRSVQVAALSLGGLALTGTAAHADWHSGPNVGFFNGNQTSTTVQVPVNICGNSLAILGIASANCNGGANAYSGNGGNSSGAGNANASSHKKKKKKYSNNAYSSSNGNGGAYSNGGGGANAYSNNGDWTSGYNVGLFNGNQTSTTVQVPINVSCNSVAVIGISQSC
ncbi:chaplin family protein [Dactylosporangium sp. AC04546]|uniref:chaplin family protein n=1 Tax=Dactylosporangium sp. AC04546 TaxID=2862460 RepID=UPI001EE11790|nr:chaplin family protein [Dactylosporangium sp. AC04546]WVK87795.1 chaplin family protein [Dactylosporangium sp. AC04546]